jgi:ABC-2 type transport system permease protein
MSSGVFTPRPGAAPWPAMAWAQARIETRLLLRNGEQLLLALVIPVLLLIGGAEAGGVLELGRGRRIDVLTPGVIALAVISASFTSLAITTGFERRYRVLQRLGATPLPRSGLLAGKALSLLTVEALQLTVIAAVAGLLGWHPHGGAVTAAAVICFLLVGTATFAALGLLMAGTLRAEATLAGANLVYVVLLVAGAVVVPAHSYPSGMRSIVQGLPSGALAEGLRHTLAGDGFGAIHLAVLAGWGLIAALLTMRTFRWQ